MRWLTLLSSPWRCNLVGWKCWPAQPWLTRWKYWTFAYLHLGILHDIYPKLLYFERDGRDLGMSHSDDVGFIECFDLTWFSGQNIKFQLGVKWGDTCCSVDPSVIFKVNFTCVFSFYAKNNLYRMDLGKVMHSLLVVEWTELPQSASTGNQIALVIFPARDFWLWLRSLILSSFRRGAKEQESRLLVDASLRTLPLW